ncbi:MAG: class I SAM-dependent methyltransferase [Acidiferrobacterales bacterium]
MSKMLNIGCGNRYHPSWVNVNYHSTGEGVIPVDIRRALPFENDSFDVVYHSHVLEHLPKDSASIFLRECHRVLRSGGILRVVVPDLRDIAKQYLLALEHAEQDVPGWSDNYEWISLELMDQMTRNQPGGEMARYLAREDLPNAEYVVARCGIEVKQLINNRINESNERLPRNAAASFKSMVKRLFRVLKNPGKFKEHFIKRILKDEYRILEMGRFRNRGEVHQWMYDSYSLSNLISQCGFIKIVTRKANESYLSDWNSYNLDTEPDGEIYKPDSLYMEAIKP